MNIIKYIIKLNMNTNLDHKNWVIKIFKGGKILYTFVICKAEKERIPKEFNKIVLRIDKIKQQYNEQV